MKRGKLLVISGPSGVGKSTIIHGMLERYPEMYFSVSATTREKREGDREGVTYLFKTRAEFEAMIAQGAFYEYAEYSGNYYGTPRMPVERRLDGGIDVIMDIDTQGAMQIREKCADAVLIFLAAPSFEMIRQRLESRGDTRAEDVEKRLAWAKWEYRQAEKYDYIVINGQRQRAVDEIDSILTAEKLRAPENLELLRLEEFL